MGPIGWLLACMAGSALAHGPVEEEPDLPVAPVPFVASGAGDVRLLVTGDSGGIGSGTYRFRMPDALRAFVAEHGEVVDVVPFHGAMTSGDSALVASDGKVATLVSLLDGGKVSCGEPSAARLSFTRSEVLLLDSATAPTLAAGLHAGTQEIQVRSCSNQAGAEASLYGEVPQDWGTLEFRLSMRATARLDDTSESVVVIGRPHGEGARRLGLLRSLREADMGMLFVDTGSFVDGASSVRDHALSLHRPLGFEMLRKLAPAALVPGRTELVAGAAGFLKEAGDLPYIATNWTSEDESMSLPDVREVTVGETRVALLGVVDPDLGHQIPALLQEGVVITDPVTATQAVVERLHASDHPPHLVVLLTAAGSPWLTELQDRLTAVDLIIGGSGPRLDRVLASHTEVRAARADHPPPSVTLPLDGVAVAEIGMGDSPSRMVSVRHEPKPVGFDLPPDRFVLDRVNATRKEAYPPLDVPLLPAPPGNPTGVLDGAEWQKLVCEAALAFADADIALLDDLPGGVHVPGEMSELLVVDRLAVLDRLEVHEIPGDRLPRLLDQADGVVPNACGAPLGSRFPKTGGRSVEAERSYRVVTTDVYRTEVLGPMLAEARSPWLLDRPGFGPLLGAHDTPTTLRTGVLGELRRLRDSERGNLIELLNARTEGDKPPLWLLRARRISFAVARFQGVASDAYAAVPETLATSPSSLTIESEGDLALDYSSKGVNWDLRAKSSYSRLVTADDVQEPADDLQFSTSASLPGAGIPLGSALELMPFTEVLYDSELTPVEPEEGGAPLPLQQDLSLTAGLSAKRQGVVRGLRAGALVLRDLGDADKATEYGGRADAELRVTLGPGVYWTTVAEAYVFADTPDQTEADLRFKALLDTRLQLPLTRALAMGFYGSTFLFAGRVPSTQAVAASTTLGASLDLVGAFEL
jgi:hypothetical protein